MLNNSDASPRVLLVEGQDDEHVVRHLRERNLPMPEFGIIDRKSISNLLRAIEADVLAPRRTAVGILVDADESLDRRWQAVTDRLRRARITPPSAPDPTGTIIDGNPRIGVWMMPDNESSGELENLVARMIPASDAVWPLSEAYIAGIPPGVRMFGEGKHPQGQSSRMVGHTSGATEDGSRNQGQRPECRGTCCGPACRLVATALWLRGRHTSVTCAADGVLPVPRRCAASRI